MKLSRQGEVVNSQLTFIQSAQRRIQFSKISHMHRKQRINNNHLARSDGGEQICEPFLRQVSPAQKRRSVSGFSIRIQSVPVSNHPAYAL